MPFQRDSLDAQKITETIERLCRRIEDRFPESGLAQVARRLLENSRDSTETLEWIERADPRVRIAVGAVVGLLVLLLVYAVGSVSTDLEDVGPAELVSLIEAGTNELILIGAAILFLVSLETRAKRRRVIAAVNGLHALAHVIDAHQLTKDPLVTRDQHTAHSPERSLEPYLLQRYLDYCSELLSLTSKVGFLYVQRFEDPVSQQAVNDLEQLTTGLARKIWQKLMILHSTSPAPGE